VSTCRPSSPPNRVGEHVADHLIAKDGIGVCDARERLGRGRRFSISPASGSSRSKTASNSGAALNVAVQRRHLEFARHGRHSHPQAQFGLRMLAMRLVLAAESRGIEGEISPADVFRPSTKTALSGLRPSAKCGRVRGRPNESVLQLRRSGPDRAGGPALLCTNLTNHTGHVTKR